MLPQTVLSPNIWTWMINTVELKYGGTIDHNNNFQDSDKKLKGTQKYVSLSEIPPVFGHTEHDHNATNHLNEW